MSRIFISYRRDDSSLQADRLYDRLSVRFGEDDVFMDRVGIGPGEDFRTVIRERVRSSDLMLVLIGDQWLTAADASGRRRLEDPQDFVRLEVASALEQGVRVIPVLVEGAPMPQTQDLPRPLDDIVWRHAVSLSDDHWRADVGELIERLERTLRSTRTRRWRLWARRKRLSLLATGAVVVLGLAIVVSVAGVFRGEGREDSSSSGWTTLPRLPVALEGAAVGAYDGRMWVVGGISAGEGRPILDRVDIYDPGTRTWRPGPSLPVPLYYAALASTGTQLYLVGGLSSGGAVDTVYRLDSPTAQWELARRLPAARGAGAAAWDGHRLVFAGGVGTDHRAADDVWALEGSGWRRLGRLRPAREKLASATDQNGTVWFLAGRDPNATANAYPAVDVAKAESVTPGGRVSAVQAPAAVWWPSHGVCLIGGQAADGFSGRVECLDRRAPVPALSVPRAGLGAAVLGRTVFVAGGYDAGRHGMRTVEGFEVATAAQ